MGDKLIETQELVAVAKRCAAATEWQSSHWREVSDLLAEMDVTLDDCGLDAIALLLEARAKDLAALRAQLAAVERENERLRGALSTVPGQIDHERMWIETRAEVSRLTAKCDRLAAENEKLKADEVIDVQSVLAHCDDNIHDELTRLGVKQSALAPEGPTRDGSVIRIRYLAAQRDRLAEALREIVEHPHNTYDPVSNEPYQVGVVDGHRCAADIARAALAGGGE